MIFAQMNRYAKTHRTFSPDDRQGASVAHADLLRAVLMHSSVEAVELYTNGSPKQAPQTNLEFEDLCREFPDKAMRLRNFDELGDLGFSSKRVFYSSGVFLSPLAQVRRSSGNNFPICALSHALDVPMVLLFFPGSVLLGSEHDTIITSSLAGKQAIVNLAESCRGLMAATFGPNVPAKSPRVDVIPLGIDIDFLFPRDKRSSRELLHLPADETILLYLGRLHEEHKADLEPLFIVVRQLLRKHEKVTLLIAGNDPDNSYFGELDAMAVRLGVRDKVRFLLNFQDFLKPAIYSASDVLVSPIDNIQETFGLSVVEAMACGLPIVASDWSGYRELVVHGRTGFLTPTLWNPEAADSASRQAPLLSDGVRRHMMSQQTAVLCSEMYRQIEELVAHPELRASFGAAGLERARTNFSTKTVVKMHEALWGDLWERIDKIPPSADRSLTDDWDFVFRHFATDVVTPELMVRRSGLRSDINDALRFRPAKPGYAELNYSELQSVMERASLFPVSLRELLDEGLVADAMAVTWMLKKGYLKVAERRGA